MTWFGQLSIALLIAGGGIASAAGVQTTPPLPPPPPAPPFAMQPADATTGVPAGLPGEAEPPLPPAPPSVAAKEPPPGAPAKQIFGALGTPSAGTARVIGFYANGCLAGGVALPIDGETWQAMRLSRNRNWGHPALIAVLERLSKTVGPAAGWPGLLVGDIAQPRGGPMLTGHASHQVGLDADIWLTPMPGKTLSRNERETMVPTNVVAADWNDVDPQLWTSAHLRVLRAASEMPQVERIFVNPAIKKALCREAGTDRGWLGKIRPMYGHNYHFHVRIGCPPGETVCKAQASPPPGDGCGADLAYWFSDAVRKPKPAPKPPVKPAPPLPLSALPAQCRQVAVAP